MAGPIRRAMQSRRAVIANGLAALLLPALPANAQSSSASREAPDTCLPPRTPAKSLLNIPIVDIHCHIFNGTDLPAASFLDRRIKEVTDNPGVGKFALDLLLPGARDTLNLAASYQVEKEILEHLTNPNAAPYRQNKRFFPTTEAELDKSLIMARIRAIADGDADMVAGIKRVFAAVYFARQDDGFGAEAADPSRSDEFRALREINKAWLPLALQSTLRQSAEFPIAKDSAGQLAERSLVKASRKSPRRLAWAMTRTRTANYQTLRGLYGPVRREAATKPHVRLFTPAMVDFEYWYDRDAPSRAGQSDAEARGTGATSPARQVELMRLLMKAYPGEVHPFVSFCPWRDADAKLRLKVSAQQRPLGLVKEAVSSGFVGVKIYPPAGFRPGNNAKTEHNSGITVPPHFDRTVFLDDKEFGAALDESLQDLYGLCAAEDIPIMVHTSYSNSGADDLTQGTSTAEYSHPRYWKPILDKYPALRLNFAHMGLRMRSWLQNVGVIMDTFDNVYADVAYVEQALYDTACRPAQCVFKSILADTFLQAREGNGEFYYEQGDDRAEFNPDLEKRYCADDFSGLTGDANVAYLRGKQIPSGSSTRWRRVMYGSDWSMVGVQADSANYLDVVANRYHDAVGDIRKTEAFLSTNALMYLGLASPNGTSTKQRARLQDFYARKGTGLGWSADRIATHFAKFDAAAKRTHGG
jgi:predicted TIM-barrel fold metal-dependent hydrolase